MLKHLTFEELLEFNAMTYDDTRASDLASRVTSHIRTCKRCLDALSAVQSTEAKFEAKATKKVRIATEGKKERLF